MKSPKEIVEIMMTNDSFSRWLGIEVTSVGKGFCELRLPITQLLLNGFGILHGGISYSIADTALAFASNAHGMKCVSIESSISHIRQVQNQDILTAVATEVHRGKTTGIYHVLISNQYAQKVADFKGTVFVMADLW